MRKSIQSVSFHPRRDVCKSSHACRVHRHVVTGRMLTESLSTLVEDFLFLPLVDGHLQQRGRQRLITQLTLLWKTTHISLLYISLFLTLNQLQISLLLINIKFQNEYLKQIYIIICVCIRELQLWKDARLKFLSNLVPASSNESLPSTASNFGKSSSQYVFCRILLCNHRPTDTPRAIYIYR